MHIPNLQGTNVCLLKKAVRLKVKQLPSTSVQLGHKICHSIFYDYKTLYGKSCCDILTVNGKRSCTESYYVTTAYQNA